MMVSFFQRLTFSVTPADDTAILADRLWGIRMILQESCDFLTA